MQKPSFERKWKFGHEWRNEVLEIMDLLTDKELRNFFNSAFGRDITGKTAYEIELKINPNQLINCIEESVMQWKIINKYRGKNENPKCEGNV